MPKEANDKDGTTAQDAKTQQMYGITNPARTIADLVKGTDGRGKPVTIQEAKALVLGATYASEETKEREGSETGLTALVKGVMSRDLVLIREGLTSLAVVGKYIAGPKKKTNAEILEEQAYFLREETSKLDGKIVDTKERLRGIEKELRQEIRNQSRLLEKREKTEEEIVSTYNQLEALKGEYNTKFNVSYDGRFERDAKDLSKGQLEAEKEITSLEKRRSRLEQTLNDTVLEFNVTRNNVATKTNAQARFDALIQNSMTMFATLVVQLEKMDSNMKDQVIESELASQFINTAEQSEITRNVANGILVSMTQFYDAITGIVAQTQEDFYSEDNLFRLNQTVGRMDEMNKALDAMRYHRTQELSLTDCYNTLHIPVTSGEDAIKTAYRTRSLETHPDRNPGKDTEYIRVQDAYQKLTEFMETQKKEHKKK